MTTARVIVSLLVAASGLAFIGCADDPTTHEGAGSVEQKWSPVIGAGNCPDPSRGSTEKLEWYQGKATTVIKYLVGGKEPFTSDELSYVPACKDAFTSLTNLRNMLASSPREKYAAPATMSFATAGTACTLSAAMYTIEFSAQVPFSVWEEQQKVGEQLDKCWGYGVSGFYFADDLTGGSGSDNGKTPVVHHVYIDPEPARLTKDLFGLTGATAAAIYENTGAETGVLKYPGGWVNPPSPPTPGQPCSTTDLANGSETLKILQGSGTWRRCW